MIKFDFLKKYIRSHAVQTILLLNYPALWLLVQCYKRILEAPDGYCGSSHLCSEVAGQFFLLVWIIALVFNAITLFLSYFFEKFVRKKLEIYERNDIKNFQYFFFYIGLFPFLVNTLGAPLLALLAIIKVFL